MGVRRSAAPPICPKGVWMLARPAWVRCRLSSYAGGDEAMAMPGWIVHFLVLGGIAVVARILLLGGGG
jgi:hypothetical protein